MWIVQVLFNRVCLFSSTLSFFSYEGIICHVDVVSKLLFVHIKVFGKYSHFIIIREDNPFTLTFFN